MKEKTKQLLKSKGLKITGARIAILEFFGHGCKPLNAEDIFKKVKSKKIDQVTVYRTLKSFEEVGIIKKVNLHKDSVYYEMSNFHHHHIVCVGCNKTESFENCDVDSITKNVLKKSPLFKTVSEHSLELYGMCKSCSRV